MVFSDQIEIRIKAKQGDNTMHVTKILHLKRQQSCPQIHTNRLTALVDVVTDLITGQTRSPVWDDIHTALPEIEVMSHS